MELIRWETIKHKLKKILNIPGNKTYLSKLIDNIEKQYAENNSLPFIITDIREKGFIVKIAKLTGYISFYHMPWNYETINAWRTVFPYIKGKIFFGKIYQFSKEPQSIIINGEIPQFKKPELIANNEYNGIIVKKINYGVFVDIGYSFKWKYGSLVGLFHKSNFETTESFEEVEVGEVVELKFWGYNEKEQLIFSNKTDPKEWFTGEIEKLIGQVLPVNVLITEDQVTSYLVENKYQASLSITEQINKAVRNLKNGDIIHCKIVRILSPMKMLQLRWESESEIEEIILRNPHPEKTVYNKYNTIQNRVNDDIVEKLNLIGKTVKVVIIKRKDPFGILRTKYLVEDKYLGKLNISNKFSLTGKKEIKQIEKNLQNGEIINCEVLSFNKKIVNIKWNFDRQ